jgi:hypothetical protein
MSKEPFFHSVAGSAEATSLPDQSIDLITSAQAFHWFDRVKAKAEFQRILRPGKWAALIWNERQSDGSTFSYRYEELLRGNIPEYGQVNHRNLKMEDIGAFFRPGEVTLEKFSNTQKLNQEAFIGRLLSSSYVPLKGEPGHQEIVNAARRLFEEHAVGGMVSFEYQTMLYLGRFELGQDPN